MIKILRRCLMNPFPAAKAWPLVAFTAFPLGLTAQSLDPVPRPRPTLPIQTPPPAVVPVVETPPPIFVPGFFPSIHSQLTAADSNLVVMAPFEVKERGLFVLKYQTPRPVQIDSPFLHFIRTGIIYEHVGKKLTIVITPFGVGISW